MRQKIHKKNGEQLQKKKCSEYLIGLILAYKLFDF